MQDEVGFINTIRRNSIGILSIVFGILAVAGAMIAFFPLLGILNWINIPFSLTGIIFGGIALANPNTRNQGIAGLVLASYAVIIGIIRLKMGFGIL